MKKKTVIITGSSRGIGAEMARQFAKNNYNVVINYNKSKDKAMEVLEQITKNGGTAIAVKADIRVLEEVEYLYNTTIKTFGTIDVLINNAGIALTKLFIDCSFKDYQEIFYTNFRGGVALVKLVLPHMLSNGHGKIINITSVWGQTGGAMEVLYSASKGAIISFTKALAKEYALSGITVNAIAPGVIKTDMIKRIYIDGEVDEVKKKIPMGEIADPIEVANLALFLASENANYITGQVLAVNGGFYC